MFSLTEHERRYLATTQPKRDEHINELRRLQNRPDNLTYTDRQSLADILEYHRYVERQAMRITPPKHSATRESEDWAASFWFRLRFLDDFIHHLRGVAPAPELSGQNLGKTLIGS